MFEANTQATLNALKPFGYHVAFSHFSKRFTCYVNERCDMNTSDTKAVNAWIDNITRDVIVMRCEDLGHDFRDLGKGQGELWVYLESKGDYRKVAKGSYQFILSKVA